MSALPDWLPGYFADRDRERREDADKQLVTLTEREQGLVREAAVCGFVQGVMHAGGLMSAEMPKDSEVLFRAVNTAQMHPDLYPLIGTEESGKTEPS